MKNTATETMIVKIEDEANVETNNVRDASRQPWRR